MNRKLFDINGNRAVFRRMSSLVLPENIDHVTLDGTGSTGERRTSCEVDNGLVDQIQKLLTNAKCCEVGNANTDRKNPSDTLRWVSDENQSGSNEYLYINSSNILASNVENSVVNNHKKSEFTETTIGGRRKSACSTNSLRPTFTKDSNKRRVSLAATGGAPKLIHPGRRYSVVQGPGSKPQQSRRVSQCSETILSTLMRSRRRSSTTKPVTFLTSNVKKTTTQKRLEYRMRRRKDRAQVNIAEVRRAISADTSEFDLVTDDGNDDNIDAGYDAETQGDTNDAEGVSDTQDGTADDEAATRTERRRTSIQVRAWELSRRLRQRRRAKIKSCTM